MSKWTVVFLEGYYAVGLATLTFDIKVANVYYLTLLINQIRQENITILKSLACKRVKIGYFDQPMAVGRNSIDQYLQRHVSPSTVVVWLEPGTPESECIKKKFKNLRVMSDLSDRHCARRAALVLTPWPHLWSPTPAITVLYETSDRYRSWIFLVSNANYLCVWNQ